MVGPSGIEPETFRLSIECSKPIELRPYINWSLLFLWALEVMLLVMRALYRAPAGVNWIPIGQSSTAAYELPLEQGLRVLDLIGNWWTWRELNPRA